LRHPAVRIEAERDAVTPPPGKPSVFALWRSKTAANVAGSVAEAAIAAASDAVVVAVFAAR
jgi:hypothetical protein